MPGLRTAYLGQFTDETANAIAERLVDAGIPWYFKQSGLFGRVFFMGEWGTRLFVDAERLDEAREIVRRLSRE